EVEGGAKTDATADATSSRALQRTASAPAATDARILPDAAAHARLQADLAASQHAVAMIHLGMGKALRDKGDLDGAVTEIREAIRLRPEDPELPRQLEDVLKAGGDRESVRRAAAAVKPDDFAGQVALGLKLQKVKDLDGAVAAFRAATRIKPGDS